MAYGTVFTPRSCTELFEHDCPYYLSLGVSYKDYWFGDTWMIVNAREADKINRERKNYEMWLQGMYIHHGVSIAISNALGKKGSKPELYPDKPYAITKPEQKQRTEEQLSQETENKRLIAMLEDSKFTRAAKRSLKARQEI